MYRLVTGLYQIEQDFICTSGLPSSSPVSRTESLETQCFKAFLFFVACDFSSPLIIRKNMFTRGEECAPLE